MLRMIMMFLPAFLALPAHAIYKCESGGKVTYSDERCPGGKLLEVESAPADAGAAARQTAQEKSSLKRLEHERHKREAQQEKEQQRAAHAAAAKQKRCSLLARRKKWSEEDAARATGKSSEKLRIKVRRVTEQFEAECGNKL